MSDAPASASSTSPSSAQQGAAPVSPNHAQKQSRASGQLVTPPAVASKKFLSPQEKRAKLKEKEEKLKKVEEEKKKMLQQQKTSVEQRDKEARDRLEQQQREQQLAAKKQFSDEMKTEREVEKEREEKERQSRLSSSATSARSSIKLGLKLQQLTGNIKGLKITDVSRDSPAYLAEMEAGDIIKQVNGKICHTKEEFNKLAQTFKPLQSVPFVVWRNGTTITCVIHCIARHNTNNEEHSSSSQPTSPQSANNNSNENQTQE